MIIDNFGMTSLSCHRTVTALQQFIECNISYPLVARRSARAEGRAGRGTKQQMNRAINDTMGEGPGSGKGEVELISVAKR